MDRERLDRWCEWGILGLILAVLVFSPLATGAVRTLEFLIVQGLTMGVVILWGIRLWLDSRFHLWWPPVCWAAVAFFLYAIARYLFAEIEFVARQELIRVVVYAFLFFAIINNLNRQEFTRIVSFGLILLAVGLSLYALTQMVTESDKVWHFTRPPQYAGRAGGTFINPNHLAGFLEMILPLALAYTLIGRLGHATKVVLGYGAVLILIGIGVTISRGGWFATVLALVVFFGVLLFQRDFRLRAIIMLSILAVVTGLLLWKSGDWQERFEKIAEAQEVEDVRLAYWRPAIEIWQDHILWGAGPGHFDHRFRQYRPPELQLRPMYVHNDYLQALADWGLAGTVLIAGVFGLLFRGVFQTWPHVRRAPNDFGTKLSNKSTFVLGASVGLLAMLFHAVVEFNMQIPSNAILAITLAALLSGYMRYATERFWFTPGAAAKLAVTVVLAAGLVYLGWQGWRRGAEYSAIGLAAGQPQISTERAMALKKAYAIEPMNFRTAQEIGEIYRRLSWEGRLGYEDLAREAMVWFGRSMELNPYDAFAPLRYGMCLVWLDRPEEAGEFFERALQVDPNSHFVVAHRGWYAFQLGRYEEAREWFQRSLDLRRNPLAAEYLQIIREIENRAPLGT